jgi:ABC-type sulfate transport system substrate-binding protein
MPYYIENWEELRPGDKVTVYTRHQGQSDAELAAGADAHRVGTKVIDWVDPDNIVHAHDEDYPQGHPTTYSRGYHQITKP